MRGAICWFSFGSGEVIFWGLGGDVAVMVLYEGAILCCFTGDGFGICFSRGLLGFY